MKQPLVSILIPVYNAGEYLRPCVESVLSQTYSNLEIFIIDDGSTDGCINSIRDFCDPRIRIIIQEKNAGTPTALNRALEEISSMFYAVQGADDISYPHRIERQVQCMMENTNLAAVFTDHDIILSGRHLAPLFSGKDIQECRKDIEQMRMPAADATVMYRMAMVRNMRYEPTLRIGQGIDYILRVGERYPMMVLGECLYSWRYHPDSTTHRDWILRGKKVKQVFERACRRRGLDKSEHFFAKHYKAHTLIYREQEYGIVPHFMQSVLDLRNAGRFRQAVSTAFACLRLHPCDPYYYKPLTYLVAPMTLIRCYRSIKKRRITCRP